MKRSRHLPEMNNYVIIISGEGLTLESTSLSNVILRSARQKVGHVGLYIYLDKTKGTRLRDRELSADFRAN